MKKIFIVIFTMLSWTVFAQKQTYDLLTYSAPKGWKKDVKESATSLSFIDKKDKSWCQIGIYKSTTSSGTIDQDFESEWNELVVKTYQTTEAPQTSDVEEGEGWKIKSGSGRFTFNKKPAAVILTTFSGYGRCISIVATMGNRRYLQNIQNLIGSVELTKPIEPDAGPANWQTGNPGQVNSAPVSNGFTFTTSNFDDGWTSVVKEDWVEVTKGNIKILLHYANSNVKPANTDVNVMCEAAWNVLVAPRYGHIQNYQITPGVLDYQRPYYAQANLTDNASGKKVFVALFRKGNTGWLEFIAPDQSTFIQNFGLDISTINYYSEPVIWEKLIAMNNYNRFAIAAGDFVGKWTDRFSSSTYYTNIYTGNSAGMSTYSSSQTFEFNGANYKWNLVAANSYAGRSDFNQAKGKGTFKVLNNWQIYFSEMEGKPKTFDVYFSAIKGGRILWMNDAQFPGSGIFTGFSKQ